MSSRTLQLFRIARRRPVAGGARGASNPTGSMLRAFAPNEVSPLLAPIARRRTAAALLALAPTMVGGCSPSESAARAQHAPIAADSMLAIAAETARATVDTQLGTVTGGPTPQGEPTLPSQIGAQAARAPRKPRVVLSPLADTIAGALVFAPRTQTWFTASTRAKRMLIDLGRVDADVKKTPERLAAYREAVVARSTFAPETRFRLHGAWGVEEATIADYDVWNGRIVGVAQGSPLLDSIAKHAGSRTPVTAAAELLPAPTYAAGGDSTAVTTPTDSSASGTNTTTAVMTTVTTTAPRPTRCVRDSASEPLAARAAVVRDSLDLLLHQTQMPPYEEVAKTITVQSSQAIGCFLPPAPALGVAGARAAASSASPARGLVLAVSLRDEGREYLKERIVLIDDATGAVTPLRIADLRFKAHDLVAAFDADGDGVDDLIAKGVAEASGATVVLRFDPKEKKFLRLASGFAWESR